MGLNTIQEIKCTWPLAEITGVDKVVVFYYEVVPPQPSLWESVPRDYGCASVLWGSLNLAGRKPGGCWAFSCSQPALRAGPFSLV